MARLPIFTPTCTASAQFRQAVGVTVGHAARRLLRPWSSPVFAHCCHLRDKVHGWKLVSSELCGADADPLLAQLLCLVPPGTVQRVSVFREVIEVGEIFTVCSQVFMPLLFCNLQSQLSQMIFFWECCIYFFALKPQGFALLSVSSVSSSLTPWVLLAGGYGCRGHGGLGAAHLWGGQFNFPLCLQLLVICDQILIFKNASHKSWRLVDVIHIGRHQQMTSRRESLLSIILYVCMYVGDEMIEPQ